MTRLGDAFEHASPTMTYLPGEQVGAATRYPEPSDRLAQLVRLSGKQAVNSRLNMLVELAGVWHHHFHTIPVAMRDTQDASLTSALLYQPLVKALEQSVSDPLATLMTFKMLFAGTPERTNKSLGWLSRKDAMKAIDMVAAAQPNPTGYATRSQFEALRDNVLLPALGLQDPSTRGVYIVPRQEYDIVLQGTGSPAKQLQNHIRALSMNCRPSVIHSNPHYCPLQSTKVCGACRLHDLLRGSTAAPEKGSLMGTNLRCTGPSGFLAGSNLGWYDYLGQLGTKMGSAVNSVTQGTLTAFGLGVDKAEEERHPYNLKVHEAHHRDPHIVVDFDITGPVEQKDWIGLYRPEDDKNHIHWFWTHGKRQGRLKFPMAADLTPGAYEVKYLTGGGVVRNSKAFPLYREATNVCPALDKMRIGMNKMKGGLEKRLTDMAMTCNGISGLDQACMMDKVQDRVGVSAPCANCVAKMSMCARQNCKSSCFWDPHSAGCRSCSETACMRDFKSCAGLP